MIQYAANDVHRSIDLFESFESDPAIWNELLKSATMMGIWAITMNLALTITTEDQKLVNNLITSVKYGQNKVMKDTEYLKNRCFICKFFEVYHKYFPCK